MRFEDVTLDARGEVVEKPGARLVLCGPVAVQAFMAAIRSGRSAREATVAAVQAMKAKGREDR